MDKIYIFGHKNPDTDSVCSSIAYANLKNKLGFNAEPRILSPINPETKFVLDKFNLEEPKYLNDVKVKIKDVKFHKNYLINENKPIIDAYNMMNKHSITGIPLVDDDNKLTGYVSLKEVANEMIFNESIKISTTFDDLVNILESKEYIKCDEVIEGYAHAATFDDASFIRDIPLDNESILIVGDRASIISYALTSKVKLIIVVKDKKLTKEQKKIAKENNINVICTPKSSFKIARVLCLANPIKSIKRGGSVITFNKDDYLTDFIEATSKLKHTNYPIVDSDNVCLGMLRTIDAHETNKKKVILVDHNMVGQSVDGLYEADILEIIDHHNIGDINTSNPINFRNMAVGSSCTIVFFLYRENNIKVTKDIAGLLLSGIISDTLMLKSPTTTEVDKMVAKELARIAKLNINKYGLELLESGVSIEGMSPSDIIFKDFKIYTVNERNMVVGQVFTTDYKEFARIENELVEELDRVQANHDYDACVLFVTNFLTNNSNVLYAHKCEDLVATAFGIKHIEEGFLLKDVVSRKKQIVPNLMDVLESR
jgi:manganese-dependent inorganic pyrophosphatase